MYSLITNSTGSLVEETTYEPFGKVSSGGTDRFLYTRKELDPNTGLEYYGARYYDPSKASQFTQPDSVIADIYNPQSLNRYSYVLNNPYRYVDPTGNGAVSVTVGPTMGFSPFPMVVYPGIGKEGQVGKVMIYNPATGTRTLYDTKSSGSGSFMGGGIDYSAKITIDFFSNTPEDFSGESSSYELTGIVVGGFSAGFSFPKNKNGVDYSKPSFSIGFGTGLEGSYSNFLTQTNVWLSNSQPNVHQAPNQPAVWGPTQADANAPGVSGGSGGSGLSSNPYIGQPGLEVLRQPTGPSSWPSNTGSGNNKPDTFEQNKASCGCDKYIR